MEKEAEECPICYESISDKVTLKCGHNFNYNCILESYKSNLISNNLSYTYNRRECPYCRRDGGYLPLKENMIPIQYIHKEYSEYKKYIDNNNLENLRKFINPNMCHKILERGINKGKQCSKKKCNEYYCKVHSKYMIKLE